MGFTQIPNDIVRGGHGTKNLAVLFVLVSHGRTTASIAKLAEEVGCDKKSILPAIRYWIEHGKRYGVTIKAETAYGRPTVYRVAVLGISQGITLGTERSTSPENGSGGHPKTGHPPHPKTGHKEEPMKNNKEELGSAKYLAGDNRDQIRGPRSRGPTHEWTPIAKIIKTRNL